MFEDISRGTGGRLFLAHTDATFGHAVLDEMARATGGTAYFPERVDNEQELFGVCTQIALEMRGQYTLAFYPSATANGGGWRKLRVRVKPQVGSGRLHLSYREGYQPPKK